ncbi:cytochrome P450 3A17 [Metarhizium album ARSEF 1941]|uniref:Cytochrome P450 3A17 n=1 Tax=Metarhizium album (strain ARSEF 1941) TaxID=1081103 RepID=A0A0B2WMU4_METAS|nr:cytochrome P450 3A17 [Metarhizium album ARSEF 1941]KHN95019.1 cytochrome P450 3A17 [Metarhizium album ARSEF 1941]
MSTSDVFAVKGSLTAIPIEWDKTHFVPLVTLVASMFVAFHIAQAVYRFWFHPLSGYPGPVLFSIFYLPYLYQSYIKGRWIFRTTELHRKYGPIVRIGPNHIMVDGEIGWPQVFGHRKADQSEYEKMPVTHEAKADSIIVAPREIHRRQRRQLNHAFSDANLAEQEHVIQEYVGLLLERLQTRADKAEVVNGVKWMNCTTFDIIGDLALSESFSSLENHAVHPWVRSIFESVRFVMIRRFFSHFPLLRLVLSMFNGKFGTKQHSSRNHAKDKARRRMALGQDTPSGRRDFMTYMLRKNRDGQVGMSEEEILETSATLVLAGSETTASALSGFCFYLDKHPQIYAELTKEIRTAFNSEGKITMQNASRLEYLQACINEVLRVYPPAAETSARVSPGDFIEGTYIPPNTLVSVYQWATFRNPRHFKDPESFVPERWLAPSHPLYDERFKDDNHAVFRPFSHGSRDCIGKNLAMNELRVVISRMLYRFDFEVLEGQDDWHMKQRNFIIWDKGPLMLRFKTRLEAGA